jgi:hypothetical protein
MREICFRILARSGSVDYLAALKATEKKRAAKARKAAKKAE